jgi:hypothetical protein
VYNLQNPGSTTNDHGLVDSSSGAPRPAWRYIRTTNP